nr:hypothetical protein Itr_chr02CG25150 [Ipomoea trifida]
MEFQVCSSSSLSPKLKTTPLILPSFAVHPFAGSGVVAVSRRREDSYTGDGVRRRRFMFSHVAASGGEERRRRLVHRRKPRDELLLDIGVLELVGAVLPPCC